MGFFDPGIPQYLIDWGTRITPEGTVAIETGTFAGDSADRLGSAFGRCVTIEKSPELASRALTRFHNDPGVTVLQGSTRSHLPEAIASVDVPPFVWLDAHWSGGSTAGADDPCPVLEEIRIIASRFPGEAIVLIDDARIFGVADPHDEINASWPSLLDVLRALDDDGWVTFVIDDIIAGIPARLSDSFAGLANQSITNNTGTMALALANDATMSRSKTALLQRLRRAKRGGDELLSRL